MSSKFAGLPYDQQDFAGLPYDQQDFAGLPYDQQDFAGLPYDQQDFAGLPVVPAGGARDSAASAPSSEAPAMHCMYE